MPAQLYHSPAERRAARKGYQRAYGKRKAARLAPARAAREREAFNARLERVATDALRAQMHLMPWQDLADMARGFDVNPLDYTQRAELIDDVLAARRERLTQP